MLGPRGRRPYPLRRFPGPLAVLGVLGRSARRVHHGLDQRPLIVTRWRLRLFRFDYRLSQANCFPIPQGGQRLAVFLVLAVTTVALVFLAERGPPANLDRLSPRRPEYVAVHVEQRGRLAVAKISGISAAR